MPRENIAVGHPPSHSLLIGALNKYFAPAMCQLLRKVLEFQGG